MTSDVEQAFARAMVAIYKSAKKDLGYNATRFLQMITDRAGSPLQGNYCTHPPSRTASLRLGNITGWI